MQRPENLVEGRFYFMVTYSDVTLTKPKIASYAYAGTEQVSDDAGIQTTQYLFKYIPVYRSTETEELAEGYIAYPAEKLRDLNDIDGLLAELTEVKHKIEGGCG